jgi:hypothetical protein
MMIDLKPKQVSIISSLFCFRSIGNENDCMITMQGVAWLAPLAKAGAWMCIFKSCSAYKMNSPTTQL